MHSKTVSVLLLGATFSLCLAIVFLFFQGGAGLGFLLTVLVAEGSFCSWLWLPRPRLSALGRSVGQEHADMGIRPGLPLMAFVIVAILDLSFCYFLYDNFILKLVGFPVTPLWYGSCGNVLDCGPSGDIPSRCCHTRGAAHNTRAPACH